MFSEKHNVSMNDWIELMEYSKDMNYMVNNVEKVTATVEAYQDAL